MHYGIMWITISEVSEKIIIFHRTVREIGMNWWMNRQIIIYTQTLFGAGYILYSCTKEMLHLYVNYSSVNSYHIVLKFHMMINKGFIVNLCKNLRIWVLKDHIFTPKMKNDLDDVGVYTVLTILTDITRLPLVRSC